MASMTIEELDSRLTEIRESLQAIDAEHSGAELPEESRQKWNDLNEERETTVKLRDELEARTKRLEELGGKPEAREEGATFHVRRSETARGNDIYDLSTVRSNMSDPGAATRELKDRAKRATEEATFHQLVRREDAQRFVADLLENDTEDGQIARRVLVTGSPTYKRAFAKYVAGRPRTREEDAALERALSLTGSAGGFAVPFVLDPTIIPTSNLAVNPYRAISRVEQINVDEWRGVSSAGITAAYAAEVTAATDNAPTLAQPTISTEKAQAFIPFSIEVGMDWPSLQTEMARLLQDAKDELETTKFTLGSGTNEPFGVVTGATTVFTASNTNSIVVADLYGTEAALGPRFRQRASWIMARPTAQKIRQFDTAGGANLWVDNLRLGLENNVPTSGSLGSSLLGYPAYEASAVNSTYTTGLKVAVFGDFSYFVIVDRIGLTVEYIPHMFDATTSMPTGQRGLYCYWRNGSKVVSANAFVTLKLA